ncbi:MAG: site-specific integrase [Synergistaceae bacterium]|jgi:site-specific recombinase XerD|nr:site-specific integrase [Synergistaceae bacterium]
MSITAGDDDETTKWETVLEDYLAYLRGCGRSGNTIAIYRDQISRFYRRKCPRWDDERLHFLDWNGEPQIHTNHRLDSCGRFWKWAIREGHRKTDPSENIQKRLINKHSVANVNIADIEKLLAVFRNEHKAKPNQWEKTRNYACVLFAIGTGVRPGEGLRLRRSDFNLGEFYAIISGEHVKTRQSRVVYIPQNKTLINLLKRMIKAHVKAELPKEAALFCDSAGRTLCTRSWFHIISKRAREAGIKIKPYDLRHAFITHSLMKGANPYDLRDQVGHSNMEMMKRYYHSSAEARRNTANLAPLAEISLS